MKKLIKNKYVLLISSIIIMSILYFVVEKAIDNYNFQSNDDMSIEDTNESVETEGEGEEVLKNTEEDDRYDNSGDEEFLDDSITESAEDSSAELNEQIENKTESKNKIYVYITGEVNNPGVVILDEESRIIDAINAAGGTTSNANITKVNLVYILEDGMKVNIPNNNDLKNNSDFEYITMGSGDGRQDTSSSEVGNSSNNSQNNSNGSNKYSIVNINTATQTELETLPGIGPSLALKIINYRKENGNFSSIDEIKNVSGIGDSKFEELKSYIRV